MIGTLYFASGDYLCEERQSIKESLKYNETSSHGDLLGSPGVPSDSFSDEKKINKIEQKWNFEIHYSPIIL